MIELSVEGELFRRAILWYGNDMTNLVSEMEGNVSVGKEVLDTVDN